METRIYCEACDASAAVRLGSTTFFAAATDEDNILRVFNRDRAGMPIDRLDVTAFLEPDDPEHTEADIEGATLIGNRIYWIGSHARGKSGKPRPTRQRLFATSVDFDYYHAKLGLFGVPYKHLLADLAGLEELRGFDLDAAAARAPEEPGGLNIEGLSSTPAGELLIGFRNPIPHGRALILKLTNPAAVVEGTARAVLHVAGHLDLGGRGIRAIEYVLATRTYLIVAGPHDDRADFAMYNWKGGADDVPEKLAIEDFETVDPEELVVVGSGPRDMLVDVMSDDGGRQGCNTQPVERRTFRGTTFPVRIF